MMRAIGYARVSTAEQESTGLGIAAQKAAISAAARDRGWNLERIAVETVSGKARDRPQLEAALVDVADGGALIVAKLDRLTRSLPHLAQLLERADTDGFSIVALDLGLDTSTDTGRLVAQIMGSIADWERRRIAARTREALQVKRDNGWRPGTVLIPADVSARILDMRDRGSSLEAIAAALNADGVPTARGGKQWYRSTVKMVLDRS